MYVIFNNILFIYLEYQLEQKVVNMLSDYKNRKHFSRYNMAKKFHNIFLDFFSLHLSI